MKRIKKVWLPVVPLIKFYAEINVNYAIRKTNYDFNPGEKRKFCFHIAYLLVVKKLPMDFFNIKINI